MSVYEHDHGTISQVHECIDNEMCTAVASQSPLLKLKLLGNIKNAK